MLCNSAARRAAPFTDIVYERVQQNAALSRQNQACSGFTQTSKLMPFIESNADDDRAAEYVDSSLMTQRLVHNNTVFARVHGHYGTYRTVIERNRVARYSCTCPSGFAPCKHVRALRATWHANPGSFFDLATLLYSLQTKSKRDLIKALEQIIVAYPTALTVFGVTGFAPEDEDAFE